MHHFTLRKMKNEGKTALADMIRRYIIEVEKPANVKPKQRAARGSRKKKGQVILTMLMSNTSSLSFELPATKK